MKFTQRLDYARLAEVLHERGLAELEAIRELLQAAEAGGLPFPDAIVGANLVGDWDLSRVVCEIFQLPFLPVDMTTPNPEAMEGMDPGFLKRSGLVPIDRFGQLVTVAMPALVPADVLGLLAAEMDLVILPVVGTVETNRRWLTENVKVDESTMTEDDIGWGELFDQADAAVQMDLQKVVDEIGDIDIADLDMDVDISDDELTVDIADDELLDEASSLEFTVDPDDIDDADSLVDTGDGAGEESLPPMPDFAD